MKFLHSFLFVNVMAAVAFGSFAASAAECDNIISAHKKDKKELAELLIGSGLDKHSYAASWEFLDKDGQGPYDKTGEALVVGVTTQDKDNWMQQIGYRSIGLIISGLPEEASSTAFLRIGNNFYSEDRLRLGRGPRDFTNDVLQKYSHSKGYTEATFLVTDEEMALIQEFIDTRGQNKVIAQFDVSKKGPFKGQPVSPIWHHQGEDLLEESCAAAVLSFIDEKWLVHYDADKAHKLRQIRERLNLSWTYVARRLIWESFRNPQTSFITLHRIDASKKADDYLSDMIKGTGWAKIRGLYKYAFIPDNPTTVSDKFRSQRISLAEYLKD